MGIREDYKKWPIRRQLQTTFITTALIIVGVLIIITEFQLEWLRSKMTDKSDSVTQDALHNHISILGQEMASYVQTEFTGYIKFISVFRDLELLILGENPYSPPPIVPGSPIWHYSIPSSIEVLEDGVYLTYETGVFYSKYSDELSTEGKQLVEMDAAMDKLYPKMYFDVFDSIYAGFQTDELLHFYPGYKFNVTDYSPLTREWYYKAHDNTSYAAITQPYQDAGSLKWMFTISLAIVIDNDVYGVVAADILLTTITEKINSMIILDSGFLLLVSNEGLLISKPEAWQYMGDPLRIYEESKTGISETEWNTFIEGTPKDIHKFWDINGTEYHMTVAKVAPYENLPNITHYLCTCVKQKEAYQPISDMKDNFSSTYRAIFWVIVAIAIVTFVVTLVLIYFSTKNLSRDLKEFELLFLKIVNRGLFPDMTKKISLEKIQKARDFMPALVDGCERFVDNLKNKEEQFSFFEWGDTRPCDRFLYENWCQKIYPFNLYNSKEMSWRFIIPKLETISNPFNLFK